ncbi:MAG: hypothetical protein VX341_05815 [Bdellovibrionota bacterium]|nr:hypothetical protein [Bdellovibrionota bacterium]
MKKLILPLCLLLSQSLTYSAEADNFSKRHEELPDMLSLVNDQANQFLEEAVSKTNKQGSCDREKLIENLQMYFANHMSGKLVIDILKSDKFKKNSFPLNESIYNGWSFFEGAILNTSAESELALSPIIRMGEFMIGVDKLEHMFGMGSRYYKEHYLEGDDLSKVLRRGIFKEKTILGGNIIATGVFAYADLSANFNGMRFWNHMLQEYDDVLGQNIGPYIECRDGEYVAHETNKIDFSNYIDASMDESINCSKYATKKGLNRVKKALSTKSKDLGLDLNCPMSHATLDEMIHKYDYQVDGDQQNRSISDFIINDEGPGKISYLKEFKEDGYSHIKLFFERLFK